MNLPRTGYRRTHWTARLFAAWLVLSVVFAVAPCCDSQAAVVTGNAHATAVSHDHAGGDAPCVAWLDRNDALPVESGVPPTATPTLAMGAQFAFHLPLPAVLQTRLPFTVSASPPDALYLRYLHLIL